jgi:hypothetical protein
LSAASDGMPVQLISAFSVAAPFSSSQALISFPTAAPWNRLE